MGGKKNSKGFFKRLSHKYRFIIFNDHSYEEVVSVRLTGINLFSFIGTISMILIGLVVVLIVFTPIREYIPGYPDSNTRRELIMNAVLLDSLENELRIREQFLNTISDILAGREPRTIESFADTNIRLEEVSFARSIEDSLLRANIERDEQFNLNPSYYLNYSLNTPAIHFFTPTKGLLINRFDPDNRHFGVDVVTEPDQPVFAVLDGTVILANWTLETGFIIQIQHDNNYLSIYKHNEELLKSVGDYVSAGDAIAIVGNSGELTTGPHLHFELWQNGLPLNPEGYIIF